MTNQIPVDIPTVLKLAAPQRGMMLAAMLSVYVDENGHFAETPKNILLTFLPTSSQDAWRSASIAARIVSFLRKEGWLRNAEQVAGKIGNWYLNVERLGGVDDAIRRAQAVAVATSLHQRYDSQMIGLIISALQSNAL